MKHSSKRISTNTTDVPIRWYCIELSHWQWNKSSNTLFKLLRPKQEFSVLSGLSQAYVSQRPSSYLYDLSVHIYAISQNPQYKVKYVSIYRRSSLWYYIVDCGNTMDGTDLCHRLVVIASLQGILYLNASTLDSMWAWECIEHCLIPWFDARLLWSLRGLPIFGSHDCESRRWKSWTCFAGIFTAPFPALYYTTVALDYPPASKCEAFLASQILQETRNDGPRISSWL